MISIRSVIFGIIIAAGTSGTGFAQILGGGGSAGAFTCTANVGNPTAVRPSSYTELIGDIVITCTGGTSVAPGSAVPTVNITVAMNNTLVTSRVFSNGLSEALLLIDEPGATGAGAGALPQTVCTGGALGAAAGGCATYANTTASSSHASTCLTPGGGACASFGPTPNVFQGVVNGNQVVFNGVPVLAPVTAGLARVFRITNVRVNATQFTPGTFQGQIPVLASISISPAVPLQNPIQTTAFLFDGLGSETLAYSESSFLSPALCSPTGLIPGGVIHFREGFAAAFKTRLAPTSTVSGAGTPNGSKVVASPFTQNVPGLIAPGSESGLVIPASGGTAGLADYGTRLRATISNVPPGVSIYVSTTNIGLSNNGLKLSNLAANTGLLANAVAAGNFSSGNGVSLLAGLVSSPTAVAAGGESLPLVTATNTANGASLYGPLPIGPGGSATVAWEILLANPNAFESADFALYYTLPSAPAGPLVALTVADVSVSMGPTFGSVTASPIPSFQPAAAASSITTVVGCQSPVNISVVSSPNPSTFGQPLTWTATVTPVSGSATPTGTVRFQATAPYGWEDTTLTGGKATLTKAGLAPGNYSVIATYLGDANFAGGATAFTQVVNRAATTTSLNVGSGSGNAGQPTMFTATVTSTAGIPGGAVTFRDGATVLGTIFVDATGAARLPGVSLVIGQHSITASYAGDANFLSSTSNAQTFSVSSISTSVSTPELRSGTPAPGATLTFAATVSGDGPPLTGTVTFRDGGTTVGTSGLDGTGTATVSAALAAGTHPITASYSGDVMRSGSTSAPLILTIQGAPSVTLTSSANPANPGAAIVLTAAVAGPLSGPAPTGTVTFREGSAVIGSAAVGASGQASLTLASGLPAGEHSIVAAYGGDGNYAAATSAGLVQRVARAATATALVSSVGNGVSYLTAAVTSTAGGAITGPVEFRDATAGASLGSAALSSGQATVTLSGALPVGHMVLAVYGGDERFAGSTSATVQLLGVTNGFSFGTTFVPDSVASIFGSSLAGEASGAAGIPLPTTLAGVSVWFTDVTGAKHFARLYYVSPGQINFVVPGDIPQGRTLLGVRTPAGEWTVEITIGQSAPALASANGSGSGPAAAHMIRLHRDGTQEQPVAVSAAPIAWGGDGDRLFLVLYGTGLRHASGPVSCALNGARAPTLYAGAHAVYPGLDQVNLEVAEGMRGVISVSCQADGQASNTVTVSVQ